MAELATVKATGPEVKRSPNASRRHKRRRDRADDRLAAVLEATADHHGVLAHHHGRHGPCRPGDDGHDDRPRPGFDVQGSERTGRRPLGRPVAVSASAGRGRWVGGRCRGADVWVQ
jgi:hypothetical protein